MNTSAINTNDKHIIYSFTLVHRYLQNIQYLEIIAFVQGCVQGPQSELPFYWEFNFNFLSHKCTFVKQIYLYQKI